MFISLLISFILVALYNVQNLIENPFDNQGLDDIKTDIYNKLNREIGKSAKILFETNKKSYTDEYYKVKLKDFNISSKFLSFSTPKTVPAKYESITTP